MDSEKSALSTRPVKCCDRECSCCMMKRSFSGTWFRSVKRKYDESSCAEGDEKKLFILPQTARVEFENECAALREMVSSQQQIIKDLSSELEEERNASSSAAKEAMSMILRVQREKAEAQMELKQFKRLTEEEKAHDQLEIMALEDLLYKREQTIQSLTCEVQMYKHRMMSYGLTESEVEGENGGGCFSRNNSTMADETIIDQIPTYDYPPLKCYTNENQVYSEVVDIEDEKYAFGETPCSHDQLRDLEDRINQLEKTPRSTTDGELFKNNVLEKFIVGHSPRRLRHLRKYSTDSLASPFAKIKEISSDFTRKQQSQTEEYPKVDNSSQVGDDMSDRVYTIDSIHQEARYNVDPKATAGIADDYIVTPRESFNHTDFGDPEVTKLYLRLQALEADRESMRQAIISMRTDNAQMVLLKEIAQQLCKEMSPAAKTRVRKPSVIGGFSLMSAFKWIISLVLWRRKARRCKYMFGMSAKNTGLRMLLDKGPRVGRWRCISSTQVPSPMYKDRWLGIENLKDL
ncbi:myosin-binding protein 7-like [Nicotiana tabacum]|uniref:Myosin-binding protein 7-like n=1 Tax=Nicotiana tabacum TaxID=4097 RepID=A0AC58U432_TOBAC